MNLSRYTPNDIRRREGLEPIRDRWADALYVPHGASRRRRFVVLVRSVLRRV